MRVCIVAEHASKQFGGEAVLPFHYFRLLRARGIEAWLVVHMRTRAELEASFPADLDRMHFIDDHPLHRLSLRLGQVLPKRVQDMTSGLLGQFLTQSAQRKLIRKLVVDQRIDVVHQPIPVSPRFPSLMTKLGAPVVIGPLNGGMDYPKAFRASESPLVRFTVAAGRECSALANRIFAGKNEAEIVLVANRRTREALSGRMRSRAIELVENGVDLAIHSVGPPQPHSKRFVFIGRLVDLKAVDIAVEATARVADAELDIVGDGPMMQSLKALVESMNLGQRVRFHGWLQSEQCAQHLRASVALLLPSVLECGGAVVLEAMAAAKPVVSTDWGGPADYLDPTCGFLIAPESREAMIAGFAAAMRRLIDEPRLCEELGAAGRAKILAQFDWERKMDRMLEIYGAAIDGARRRGVVSADRSSPLNDVRRVRD